MSNVVISPNMNLPVPIVGVDPGPDWANNVNASLGQIDSHNHSTGQGVQINPNGININADLAMNGNNLISTKTVRFASQVSDIPALSPNLGCIYVSGNELVYNDEVGNIVQITKLGSVNSGAGSITGLPSGTAGVNYAAGTYTFQQATNVPGNINAGTVIVSEPVLGGNGVSLTAPTGLSSSYPIVLFPSLPGADAFVTIDTAGNLGDTIAVSKGINTANIADNAITTPLILDGAVTLPKMDAPNVQVSASSGAFASSSASFVNVTNLNVTITTSGKPINIAFQSDGSGNNSCIGQSGTGNSFMRIVNNSTPINNNQFTNSAGGTTVIPPGAMNYIDFQPAGTYTYVLQVMNSPGGNNVTFQYVVMVVREL